MNRSMFYGAGPDLFSKARMLRENMTLAESLLWEQPKELDVSALPPGAYLLKINANNQLQLNHKLIIIR